MAGPGAAGGRGGDRRRARSRVRTRRPVGGRCVGEPGRDRTHRSWTLRPPGARVSAGPRPARLGHRSVRADGPRTRAGGPPGADRDDRDPRKAVVRGLRRGPAAGRPRRRRRRGSMSAVDVDRLAKLPLFGELDSYDLGQLAGWLVDVELHEGEPLMEQGGMPDMLFVLETGTVDVLRDGERVASLGPGQVVGEISLIEPQRRTATVRATSDVRAVALPLEHLDQLEGEMPEIVRKLRWIAGKRRDELDG